jgi:hypothetical protein
MAKKRAKTPKRPTSSVEVDPAFAPVVDAFARQRTVTYGGKGFGSAALKVNGKIFAMMSSKRQFVVKLPGKRVEDLVRLGQGEYFDPGHGRLMKEWLVCAATPRWVDLAREAYYPAALADAHRYASTRTPSTTYFTNEVLRCAPGPDGIRARFRCPAETMRGASSVPSAVSLRHCLRISSG